MSERWIRHTVSAEEGGRELQAILTDRLGLSRRMIQRLTRSGGIRLNGRSAYLKRKVREGEVVAARVAFREEARLTPVEMALPVLFEDEHLLVVDKPAGLLVHPVGGSTDPTLVHGVAHHLEQRGVHARVRPVHRLDRDTSGLLVVALTAFAHQALDRQLRDRELRRVYLAIVEGDPEFSERVVEIPIGRSPANPHLRVADPRGDHAVTRLRVERRLTGAALVEAELETGRTHQIRVHLAHLGHPLLGDRAYGARRRGTGRQALHASRIGFRHPLSGDAMQFTSPLPPDLQEMVSRLSPPD